MACPNGLQQARHAQRGVRAQFQRVQELVVEAFDQAMHRLEPAQGVQVQALVAHREVTALDQGDAEVARQVGMLKVGFVVGPGGEQGNVRIGAGRAALPDALHQRAVGARQALHLHGFEGLRKQAGNDQAVFQQVAQPRGGLRALRDHPPMALRAARQIKGDNVQSRVADGFDAMHGADVTGVTLHQGGRDQGFVQQALGAVGIGHDLFQHLHPLLNALFDGLPVLLRQQQGKQVQRPGALRVLRVGIHVVGDAVVAHLSLQVARALVQVVQAFMAHMLKKGGPGGRKRLCLRWLWRTPQFIEMARCRRLGPSRQPLRDGQGLRGGLAFVFHSAPILSPTIRWLLFSAAGPG